MKKIAYDSMKLDSLKVVEDSKCCLKVNAVITKEGVYPYPDGRAFKSRMELLKATRTAKNAKITILDHPDSMVIMSQSQIYGSVEKPFFERNKIRAVLNFDKHVCPPKFLVDVRQGKLKDVSIGFYYAPEFKPGTWNGKSYDYVMRDIVIDHVAAGVLKGRCTFPSCGIGVDAMMRESASRKIGLDPFGEYSSMQDCIDKNQGKQKNPAAFCAWLHHKITGKWPAEASLSVSNKGGVNENMSLEELFYPERSKEFNECVTQRMAEGMTRGEAEAHCAAATKPKDEPTPPGGTLDQEELSPYQKCIKEEMDAGKSMEEATEACKAKGVVKGDEDAAFENCVQRLMDEGKTREEAEKECRAEHPVAEGDEEPEKTPLERCIASRMEATEDTEEEARTWCEAELAGEHESADALISRGEKLLNLQTQSKIEKRRASRRTSS